MNTNQLLSSLRARITPSERNALRDNTVAHISRYNRDTLLRMLDLWEPMPVPVDAMGAKALHAALQDYLNRYMRDDPEAHKWIILSCLFIAFAAMEPMHPQAIVGCKKLDGDYICPAREADACVTFDYPAMDRDFQKRLQFFYSKEESAWRFCHRKLKRAYPYARYRLVSGYGHVGYAGEHLKEYCDWLSALARGEALPGT